MTQSYFVFQGISGDHRCRVCHKPFAQMKYLMVHVRAQHEKRTYFCSKCQKVFGYCSNMVRHEKTCKNGNICHALEDHVCPQCGKRCSTAQGLRCHLQWHDKVPKPRPSQSKKAPAQLSASTAPSVAESLLSQLRCRRCTKVFDNRRDLYMHAMREQYNQHGGALQPRSPNEAIPWDGDDALRQVYDANAPLILEHHRQGPIRTTYNFPVTNDVNVDQLMDFADGIYRRQQRAFRLNLVFGVILQHRETGRYRYFVPYSNSGVFERPIFISRRGDLQRLRHQLRAKETTPRHQVDTRASD